MVYRVLFSFFSQPIDDKIGPLPLQHQLGRSPHIGVGPVEGAAGIAAQMGRVDGPIRDLWREVHQGVSAGVGSGSKTSIAMAPSRAVEDGLPDGQAVHQQATRGVH